MSSLRIVGFIPVKRRYSKGLIGKIFYFYWKYLKSYDSKGHLYICEFNYWASQSCFEYALNDLRLELKRGPMYMILKGWCTPKVVRVFDTWSTLVLVKYMGNWLSLPMVERIFHLNMYRSTPWLYLVLGNDRLELITYILYK